MMLILAMMMITITIMVTSYPIPCALPPWDPLPANSVVETWVLTPEINEAGILLGWSFNREREKIIIIINGNFVDVGDDDDDDRD